MKRILSLILTLCIIGTCFSFTAVVNAEEETVVITPQEQRAFEFLSALEIMVGDEDGEARLGDNMSRAEFAQLLKNILTFSAKGGEEESGGGFFDESIWEDNFFGESVNSDELLYPTEEETAVTVAGTGDFEDVSSTHWAYDAVNYVRQIGVMRGTSDTTFDPDTKVRTNEVIKCLMVMLGYKSVAEVNGGYPTGYLKFAHRLNLTNGAPAGEFCTRGAIAVILKNVMDVNILKEASYTDSGEIRFEYDSSRTFATEILGLNKTEGIMTDNGYTSIIGDSTLEGASIIVNNLLIRVAQGKEFVKFIGRDVVCWYTNNNAYDPGVAVHVELSRRDEVTEIDAADVTKASAGKIYYRDGNKVNDVSYTNAYVIKNGKAQASYNGEIFENIDQGDITVIETKNPKYGRIVVINSYETWFVANVNASEKKIYNVLREGEYVGAEDIITLDFEDPKYMINIYKADGRKGKFTDIQKNSVLDVCRLGNVYTIYVTNKVVSEFKINEIIEDKGNIYLSDGEKSFELTSAYLKKLGNDNYVPKKDEEKPTDAELIEIGKSSLELNKALTLYLNSKDRIAWTEDQAKAGLAVGYIVEIYNASKKPSNKQFVIQMYTINGTHTVYDIADKVRVSDHNGDEEKITEQKFFEKYANEFNKESNKLDGICRFTVNDQDEIEYLELPILDPDTKINGKLHRILYNDASNDKLGLYREGTFYGKMNVNSTSTKVIKVDSAKRKVDEENAFTISALSGVPEKNAESSEFYVFRAYSDVEGAMTAQYLVMDFPSGESGFDTFIAVPDVYVVTSVGGGRFPDDTLGTVIKAKNIKGGSVKDENLYVRSDAVIDTEAETKDRITVTTGYKHVLFGEDKEIEVGDVIRVSKDADGFVNSVRVIFDENGLDDHSGPNQTPGVIPGMTRYWEAAGEAPKFNCNPFAYEAGNANPMDLDDEGYGPLSGSFRAFQCYPLKIREGAVKLTAWDVIANGYENVGSKYVEEVRGISNVVVVEFKDGDIFVKTGTQSDIKSFEDFGADCSRMMIFTRRSVNCMLVINGFSE